MYDGIWGGKKVRTGSPMVLFSSSRVPLQLIQLTSGFGKALRRQIDTVARRMHIARQCRTNPRHMSTTTRLPSNIPCSAAPTTLNRLPPSPHRSPSSLASFVPVPSDGCAKLLRFCSSAWATSLSGGTVLPRNHYMSRQRCVSSATRARRGRQAPHLGLLLRLTEYTLQSDLFF